MDEGTYNLRDVVGEMVCTVGSSAFGFALDWLSSGARVLFVSCAPTTSRTRTV